MIVRETEAGFVLVRQHDHGLLSGEFARRFSLEWVGAVPEEVLFAVSNHDTGWELLDREAVWDDEADRPYSFLDYPPAPKMEAYTRGLDEIEAESNYAALLCSAHYGSFVKNSRVPEEVAFREREGERRERLRASLSEGEIGRFERDLRLLKVCDDLSLFVCLNEPGRDEHPWYTGGISFGETWIGPVWADEDELGFEPSPLREGFDISLPYLLLGPCGETAGDGVIEFRVI